MSVQNEASVPLDPEPPPGNDTTYRRMTPLTNTGAWFICEECGAVIASPDQHNDWHDDQRPLGFI